MRYFGNFDLELGYCATLQTCGMRFLGVMVDDSRYKHVSFTFFRPFLAVSGRFGNNLKQPYFIAQFSPQFDYCNNQFKAGSRHCFHHRSLLPLFLPSRQRIRQPNRLSMKLRYFPDFFAVLRYMPNSFAVMRCSATPNAPSNNTNYTASE